MLLEERKVLKEEMTRKGDPILAKEVKKISKIIKKSLESDEKKIL